MTKIILCTAVLFTSLVANGQSAQRKNESSMIIRGGLNFSNVTVNANGRVDKSNTFRYFQFGLLVDLPMASILSFQGGLLYTGKGAKIQLGDPASDFYVTGTSGPVYLEVPLQLVGKIPIGIGKAFIGAGPYAAMGISGKNRVEIHAYPNATVYSNKDIVFGRDSSLTPSPYGLSHLKRFDYGINAMAGLELLKFVFTANYGMGFADIKDASSNSDNDMNKWRVWSLTVGLKL